LKYENLKVDRLKLHLWQYDQAALAVRIWIVAQNIGFWVWSIGISIIYQLPALLSILQGMSWLTILPSPA